MNILEFDFTQFTNEQWQKVLTAIEDDWHFVDKITVDYKSQNDEIIPFVEMKYIYETQFDGDEAHKYTFTAFDVKSNNIVCKHQTKLWRQIMFKEFGESYYKALQENLRKVKEEKIKQAYDDFQNDLNDLIDL